MSDLLVTRRAPPLAGEVTGAALADVARKVVDEEWSAQLDQIVVAC